jgi:hypothetical protein
MAETPEEERIQVHVSPDLDYVYRDVVNIFVGAGDVVIEFGNRHRSMPEHVTISNRIVISVANAYDFQNRLLHTLQDAQSRLHQQLQKGRNKSE